MQISLFNNGIGEATSSTTRIESKPTSDAIAPQANLAHYGFGFAIVVWKNLG